VKKNYLADWHTNGIAKFNLTKTPMNHTKIPTSPQNSRVAPKVVFL
jgi:hypothetical protein